MPVYMCVYCVCGVPTVCVSRLEDHLGLLVCLCVSSARVNSTPNYCTMTSSLRILL